MDADLKFLIVSSGYKCRGLAPKCVLSVKNQTYQNFAAVFIDDGSNDGTFEAMCVATEGNAPKQMFVYGFPTNEGAAKRRYDAIRAHAKTEETVILLLGLDDELLPDALATIKEQYDLGKWMSYGNWINQHGKTLPEGFLEFDDQVHAERAYRRVRYRSTAPNTFKRFLFDQLAAEEFQIDGRWIDTTTESHLMFSCLEMCGKDRIGVIKKPIYLYNEALPGGTLNRLGREYKYQVYDIMINRPIKPLLTRP